MEDLSQFEKRAQEAEELIKLLTKRIEQLETEKGLNSPKASTKKTALVFKSAKEAQDYAHKRFWLFSPTWQAQVVSNKVLIQLYPPLDEKQLEAFSKAKDKTVPDVFCRFDQYFSKQKDLLETSLFQVEETTVEPVQPKKENTTKNQAPVKVLGFPTKDKFIKPRGAQVLPIPGRRNIMITSALPYVNNIPHLGNIVGSVLSADVFARYCRLRGENCIYVCGTDEYGTATETKAVQEGLTPQQICDKYNKIHAQVYEWFDIEFDKFGRTSTPQQTEIAQNIFLELHKNGFILKDSMEQLFCDKCQKFLADRFVEGTCPLCGFPDARGDQCDGCGHLLNAVELVNPRCKLDGTTPVIKQTTHLFLDLPKLNDRLVKWIDEASVKGNWSSNSTQITHGWIKEGLKPRCITRDLKWGTPVPLEEFKEKVFYVWFDAPIGYISITATYSPEWEKWWKNPDQVSLYQFMGKDNIPFHTVIFPASLIGTNTKYTLLHHVSTTEYLNYEGQKFSKSRNIGVFGLDCIETGIPSEVWRYYLLSNRPESSDSSFNWDDFVAKNNNELIANLGNFVNRIVPFIAKNFNGIVPAASTLTSAEQSLIESVNQNLKLYNEALSQVSLREGLQIAMNVSRLGNGYLQAQKPWDLVLNDKERCGTVINVGINVARLVGSLLEPYMPGFNVKLLKQLNWERQFVPDTFSLDIPAGHKIGTPEILFKQIEEKKVAEWRQKYGGAKEDKPKDEDTFPLDIRGAEVLEVGDHPNDPNLYVVSLNLGNEKRQAVARLKSHYTKEELKGKQVLVLCNLPVADLKGVQSQCMILVAEGKKKKDGDAETRVLQPEKEDKSWPGTAVVPQNTSLQIKPNILLKEFQKVDLKFSKENKVVYKQKFVLAGITAQGIQGPAKVK